MSDIVYSRHGEIDILIIEGEWDDSILVKWASMITSLRQQGCQRLLILGNGLDRLPADRINELSLPIRVYRRMGGIIAFAEFHENALQIIRETHF